MFIDYIFAFGTSMGKAKRTKILLSYPSQKSQTLYNQGKKDMSDSAGHCVFKRVLGIQGTKTSPII